MKKILILIIILFIYKIPCINAIELYDYSIIENIIIYNKLKIPLYTKEITDKKTLLISIKTSLNYKNNFIPNYITISLIIKM